MPHPRLTAAMRSVLERMARAKLPPMHTLAPQQARAAYEAGAGVLEVPKAELARVHDFHIPARDGHPLPARLYANVPAGTGPGLPALLYLHGGGFTIGSIATHDTLCRELARLSNCAVVSLDYRLAPEHRFPTAVHDAWDALQWLAAHGADPGAGLGLDTSRLAVGGDSAGGTLAAVCAILARDAGLKLALQLLVYPGCAGAPDLPSHAHYREGLVLDATLIDWFFSHYIDPDTRHDWRFAPLNADDVEGVAPAFFCQAECDPLVDEGLAYADKLRAAGVPVQLELYHGVVHEFIKMGRAIPEARQAHRDAALALAEALRPPLRLRLGAWDELREDAAPLRLEVFVREQGVPESMEWDEDDARSLHLVGYDARGQVVATGRLLPSERGLARIGRVAVRQALRGAGHGRQVMAALMQAARERGDRVVELHAQRSAEAFYRGLGYQAFGEPYDEAGIPHISMRATLAP